MTQRAWVVRAETLGNRVPVVLRYFDTKEEAESHPVKLSLWHRVWVEKTPEPEKHAATLRLPWRPENPVGSRFTYLRDADGVRIASLLGPEEQRQRVVAILVAKGIVAL